MRIGIDIDETITNSFKIVFLKFSERYGVTYQNSYGRALTIDCVQARGQLEIIDVGDSDSAAYAVSLYSDPEVLFELSELLPGARDAIGEFLAAGHILDFITSRHPSLRDRTIHWLREQGLAVSDANVHFRVSDDHDSVTFKARKVRELSLDVVVDDDHRIAEHISVPLLLPSYPWNLVGTGANIVRVNDWGEIARLITSMAQNT